MIDVARKLKNDKESIKLTSNMTMRFVEAQHSKIDVNIVMTLFIFWKIWICNFLKVTSGDEKPGFERNVFLRVENNIEESKEFTSNKYQEKKSAYENNHDANLCYLCDICDAQGACSIKGLNISSRYKGNEILRAHFFDQELLPIFSCN